MEHVAIWIRFPDVGAAAELEVMAPVGADLDAWRVLERLGVAVWNPHVLDTDEHAFAFARVTEPDGGRLSAHRAGQVLDALRVEFLGERRSGAGTAKRRSGAYPAVRADHRATG